MGLYIIWDEDHLEPMNVVMAMNHMVRDINLVSFEDSSSPPDSLFQIISDGYVPGPTFSLQAITVPPPDGGADENPSQALLSKLSQSFTGIYIVPYRANSLVQGSLIGGKGGFTVPFSDNFSDLELGRIYVIVDTESCDPKVTAKFTADGTLTRFPLDVVLYHELSHVEELLDSFFEYVNGDISDTDLEVTAALAENIYRQWMANFFDGYELVEENPDGVFFHEGACANPEDLPEIKEIPVDDGEFTGGFGSCFIATSILGQNDSMLAQMRNYRDEIIYRSPLATKLYSNFQREYYHIGPQYILDILSKPRIVWEDARYFVTKIVLFYRLLYAHVSETGTARGENDYLNFLVRNYYRDRDGRFTQNLYQSASRSDVFCVLQSTCEQNTFFTADTAGGYAAHRLSCLILEHGVQNQLLSWSLIEPFQILSNLMHGACIDGEEHIDFSALYDLWLRAVPRQVLHDLMDEPNFQQDVIVLFEILVRSEKRRFDILETVTGIIKNAS